MAQNVSMVKFPRVPGRMGTFRKGAGDDQTMKGSRHAPTQRSDRAPYGASTQPAARGTHFYKRPPLPHNDI